MNVAATIARILLGLIFVLAGALAFVFTNPPPLPGLAGTFNHVFYASHWAQFLGAAQLIAGLLLLTSRYVPIALIIIAAFVYNSFAFHLTMMPSGLFGPIIVLALWIIVALKYRPAFDGILRYRP